MAGERGSANGNSKLTGEQVKEIRRLWACGRYQRALAREFGVSRTTIARIVRRATWCHV